MIGALRTSVPSPAGRGPEVLLVLALAAWTAGLLAAAVAALNVFPVLRALQVQVPVYHAVAEDAQWRFAASHVMEGVFTATDMLTVIGALLAIAAIAVRHVRAGRRGRAGAPSPGLRRVQVLCILIGAGLVALQVGWLAPQMNRALRAQWASAAAGDLDAAAEARTTFNRLHPTADLLHRVQFLLVAGALALAPLAAAPGGFRR
ncbi:MAG: hypothetical protein KF817_09900 [Phycisphaeraceae bacterium]|nr:hypothetical protein [Phycisphaeraceae bacterium]